MLERILKGVFFFCAFCSVLSVVFITAFIMSEGLPLFRFVNPVEFLFGTTWSPTVEPVNKIDVDKAERDIFPNINKEEKEFFQECFPIIKDGAYKRAEGLDGDKKMQLMNFLHRFGFKKPKFGILAFIVGSLYVTLLALLMAVPFGLAVGIFMAEIAKGHFARVIRSAVELLAGIPSVIYGLFGYIAIAPIIRNITGSTTGLGVITASIVLAIMILPTITNITEVSLRAVQEDIKQGSLALGATWWQTVIRTQIPAAKSGIIAGVILGMGRAIGETMAVVMVAGNNIMMPISPLDLTRTLTMNIVTDMKYASGYHWTSLFTTGVVLFLFIFALNLVVQLLIKRSIERKKA